uniref:F-box domain-containing protein n=2 Tax=Caenorhabditis tropicalis TaxID=1561998 RepID=A0A1I7TUD9_9PELO
MRHKMSSEIDEEFGDLNITSSKPPPNLCDLPMELIEMIVEKLDLPKRVIVGRVCKTFREIVNGLKPHRCNEIRMTVDRKGSEMIVEGYSIKYKTPEGWNERKNLEKMLEKMMDDLLIFVPDFQLPKFSVRFNGCLANETFLNVFKNRIPQKLIVHTLVVKVFKFRDIFVSPVCVEREQLHVVEYHYMKRLENKIMHVKVSRNECTGEVGDRWKTCTKKVFYKYFRKGQEDIYVDKPELLPPKKQKRRPQYS